MRPGIKDLREQAENYGFTVGEWNGRKHIQHPSGRVIFAGTTTECFEFIKGISRLQDVKSFELDTMEEIGLIIEEIAHDIEENIGAYMGREAGTDIVKRLNGIAFKLLTK